MDPETPNRMDSDPDNPHDPDSCIVEFVQVVRVVKYIERSVLESKHHSGNSVAETSKISASLDDFEP